MPACPAFVAIDFETASRARDSACAIGAVRVEKGRVVERYHRFIRPWRERFEYTLLHGIDFRRVRDAPTFDRVWPEIRALLRGADVLVARDAAFDMEVLAACCAHAGVRPPAMRVACTLQRGRALGLRPPTLSAVARHVGIREATFPRAARALADAETCAAIALAAGTSAGTGAAAPR